MKIYLAGGQPTWPELAGHDLLVSFAEPRQLRILDKGWGGSVLLDSGAFTAWTKGQPIDLAAYIEFVKRRESDLAGYFALDVIPGQPGRLPTEDEAKRATEESMRNLDAMMTAGLRPMPIYHEGEPPEVLDWLVGQGHHVIGLGGTASRGRKELIDWMLPLFERHPAQRFHGLAVTQAGMVANLPFYSVDSSSWLNFARYGVTANQYLLKGRSPECLRRVGIIAIEDLKRCPSDAPATKGGQLKMFPGGAA